VPKEDVATQQTDVVNTQGYEFYQPIYTVFRQQEDGTMVGEFGEEYCYDVGPDGEEGEDYLSLQASQRGNT